MSELNNARSFEDDDTESDRGSDTAERGEREGHVNSKASSNVTGKESPDGYNDYDKNRHSNGMMSSPERMAASRRVPFTSNVDDGDDDDDDDDDDNDDSNIDRNYSRGRGGSTGESPRRTSRGDDSSKVDLRGEDDDESAGDENEKGADRGDNDDEDDDDEDVTDGQEQGGPAGGAGGAQMAGANAALANLGGAPLTAATAGAVKMNFTGGAPMQNTIDTSKLMNLPSQLVANPQMLGQIQVLGQQQPQHQQAFQQAQMFGQQQAGQMQLSTLPHQQMTQQSFVPSVLNSQNADLILQNLMAQAKVQNNNLVGANSLYSLPSSTGVSGNMSMAAAAAVNNHGIGQSIGITGNSSAMNTVEEKPKEQSPADSYRDFSRIPMTDDPDGASLQASTGKEPPFPVKLHRILSNPDYSDFISWLPHGRSWRVLKPKAFEEKIVPRYFRHTKYASFMRQVNGWGFKRMTQGPDHNSYYHELFLRGLPHLCYKMRRPARAKIGANDADANPDFYRLSLVAPLPNDNGANNPGLAASLPTPSAATAAISGKVEGGSVGGGSDAKPSLSQNLQGALQQQNIGNYGQLSGLNSMNSGTKGDITGLSSTSSTSNELDALRKRREELVRQLKGLQSQEVNQVQQNDNVALMNQMNPYGNYQTTPAAPTPTQFMPNQYQQMQQIMIGADNHSASQMGAGLLQIPGFNMGGQRQINLGNLVGTAASTTPAAMNQQYLIQNANGGMGTGMPSNNMMQSLNLNMMMQNQMGGLQLPNQVNPYQQYQLQQQPQLQQDQQQNNQLGNLQQGPI